MIESKPCVTVLYRDSPLRRRALAEGAADPGRYALHGLDELRAAGASVVHTLEPDRAPSRAHRRLARALNRTVTAAGGSGGDFAAVLAVRSALARCDVVFSTVDTLGIPLLTLRRLRVVARRPVVYVSVGLLDRVARLRSARLERWYRDAVGTSSLVIAFGHAEAEELRGWLAGLPAPPPVRFLPFGVDTTVFAPRPAEPTTDVLSVGSDPFRDWALLVETAASAPHLAFTAVVADAARASLAAAPANLAVEGQLPLAEVVERLHRARVVALPVADNAYSGATTTLLQAMACARPVVVSRTRAIADGYGLVDGATCRLVEPGDRSAFTRAVVELASDTEAAAALGRRARDHVVEHLGWERYAGSVVDAVLGVAGSVGGQEPTR